MNHKMERSELMQRIENFLREHKSGALATCFNDVPRSSPVQYFLGENLELFILSAGGEKFQAIRENPSVCLLVNTEYINYRKIKGVQVFGKAHTGKKGDALFDQAKKHCPEPHLMDAESHSLAVIKIIPEEIVYLDSLIEGDRTKQILKKNEVIVKEESDGAALMAAMY